MFICYLVLVYQITPSLRPYTIKSTSAVISVLLGHNPAIAGLSPRLVCILTALLKHNPAITELWVVLQQLFRMIQEGLVII